MTTNYKTVFQLSQDKGYIANWPELRVFSDRNILVELCLMQKWLRDEYFIFVNSRLNKWPSDFDWSIEDKEQFRCSDIIFHSYESALLEGIHEALKLI